MSRSIALSLILTALLAVGLGPPCARASDLGVVVVAEDGDPESVVRNHQVMRRVLGAVQEILNMRRIDVYDETAACMDITEPNRTRRKDTELIAVLRGCAGPAAVGGRPRPPIDALAMIEMYVAKRMSKASKQWFVKPRITGRMLAVRTGQVLGSFEVELEENTGRINCDARCLDDAAGTLARRLAEELATALADKVAGLNQRGPDGCLGRAQNIVVTFEGFPQGEWSRIEEMLTKLPCYRPIGSAFRPLAVAGARVQYHYPVYSDEGVLLTNLRTIMDALAAKGSVARSTAGEFLVQRTGTR